MSLLTDLLGINEKDFKALQVFMQSIRIDFPIFQKRIERMEIQMTAISIYLKKQDPIIWESSLMEAKTIIDMLNSKMKGKY